MYDIQLSERNIVTEKSKHLGLIGVFVQQIYSQTNAPRVQAGFISMKIQSVSHRHELKSSNVEKFLNPDPERDNF